MKAMKLLAAIVVATILAACSSDAQLASHNLS